MKRFTALLVPVALAVGFLSACGGSGNLKHFPVLGGIEALTVAADADKPGQEAATEVIRRWRRAGREAIIVAPPNGDWADQALRAE